MREDLHGFMTLLSAGSARQLHRHFFAGLQIAGWPAVCSMAGGVAVYVAQLHRAFIALFNGRLYENSESAIFPERNIVLSACEDLRGPKYWGGVA